MSNHNPHIYVWMKVIRLLKAPERFQETSSLDHLQHNNTIPDLSCSGNGTCNLCYLLKEDPPFPVVQNEQTTSFSKPKEESHYAVIIQNVLILKGYFNLWLCEYNVNCYGIAGKCEN